MSRKLLWLGVGIGAILMAYSATLAGPWVGLPLGVLLTAGCGTVLSDG